MLQLSSFFSLIISLRESGLGEGQFPRELINYEEPLFLTSLSQPFTQPALPTYG